MYNLSFKTFIENINETQIDALYDKAKIAVKLAELYRSSNPQQPSGQELLRNISTIANLASNAFGIYIPRENRKLLPEPIKKDLIHYGSFQDMEALPRVTLLNYLKSKYPPNTVNQLNNQIKDTGIIHVNVPLILQKHQNDEDRIMEIASTILHEARHKWERDNLGHTDEKGPEAVEKDFMRWMQNEGKRHLDQFMSQLPQNTALASQPQPQQQSQPQYSH